MKIKINKSVVRFHQGQFEIAFPRQKGKSKKRKSLISMFPEGKTVGCFQMPSVRVKLNSTDIEMLNHICNSIKEISKKSGIVIRGPIPLPTKKLKITTRKSPCGDGTATFDRYEMRIHKRLIDLPANEKVLHNIMRRQIPKDVNIKIEVRD